MFYSTSLGGWCGSVGEEGTYDQKMYREVVLIFGRTVFAHSTWC